MLLTSVNSKADSESLGSELIRKLVIRFVWKIVLSRLVIVTIITGINKWETKERISIIKANF
jgi:hypothetical protein